MTLDNNLAQVVEFSDARHILASINWSFSTPFSSGRSGVKLFDCRKYHWYPATFIPEIPYTLIEILSKPSSIIYDPFAGIGTTVFQSLILGRRPLGTEICHVAVEFMKCLWTLLHPNESTNEIQSELTGMKNGYHSAIDYSKISGTTSINIEHLRPWFSPETFNQIMFLACSEENLKAIGSKAAMRIALSATLKAACAQDRGWGCIADNVLPKPDQTCKVRNAIERFFRNLNTLLKDISEVKAGLSKATIKFLLETEFENCVRRADVRQNAVAPANSVDMIVTSPPYPNMTDYSTSQRLSYYWLGRDPGDDVRLEIGARRKRFMSSCLNEYQAAMASAINAFSHKLKPGGYACFVMPCFSTQKQNDSERRQVVQESLASLLTHGFVLELELYRILPARRRHHNQKWTSLERESISIYRKIP